MKYTKECRKVRVLYKHPSDTISVKNVSCKTTEGFLANTTCNQVFIERPYESGDFVLEIIRYCDIVQMVEICKFNNVAIKDSIVNKNSNSSIDEKDNGDYYVDENQRVWLDKAREKAEKNK